MGINLGSGTEHKVIDLANIVNELTGNEAGVVYVERRDWDVKHRLLSSIEKAIVISEIEKLGVELNERQKEALRYTFSNGFITNKIYREINGVSHKTAHLDLDDLIQKGLLVTTGKGRSTKYVPKI